MRVAVVVLGDLGRSPRMLYHALALAADGAPVDLVGEAGSPLPRAVLEAAGVRVHRLPRPDGGRPDAAHHRFVGDAVRPAARRLAALLALLGRRLARPDLILVQNPPAVPALLAALAGARLRRARVVVDWHNLTHALVAARTGRGHPVARLVRAWELALGRRAHGHLAVSRAMQRALAAWRIPSAVFRDRPAEAFVPLAGERRQAARRRLLGRVGLPEVGEPVVVAVSPTSWSVDDDYELLLAAVGRCRDGASRGGRPRTVVVVTGEGPGRARFEARIAGMASGWIDVRTAWLPPDEYPEALAAADLGLSLHRSASGLDLPMKIADLLGAGVPVCALDYGPCLGEMLHHGANGLLFATADELAGQILELVDGFPANAARLERLRRGTAEARALRWAAGWAIEARPVLWSAVRA